MGDERGDGLRDEGGTVEVRTARRDKPNEQKIYEYRACKLKNIN
jgi:hypothetical protein